MFANPAANRYPSPRISAQLLCKHCGRVARHEKWCVTCDPIVQYAYGVVANPERLTLRDRLILHALGVDWGDTPYQEIFQQRAEV
jgi:hypothetical protein